MLGRPIPWLLGLALLAFSAAAASQTSSPSLPPLAALECANPALPRAILDGPPVAAIKPPLRLVRVRAPRATLSLAVGADPHSRELGLMCVTHLRRHAGMIFVFDQSYEWEFWMKKTLIPLDMIWLEKDGTVTTISADVPASSLTTPDDALARHRGHGEYVIELNAGEAKADGIRTGTRLPVFHPR